jgi:hypothetical protein
VTTALLGKDPDVEHLRLRIAQEINRRLAEGLGPGADPAGRTSSCCTPAHWYAPHGLRRHQQIAELLERSTRMLLS